jgi:anaerobic ribonucleoside-triphosphate reductase activating protein
LEVPESDLVEVSKLVDWVDNCGVEGLTISGGEPFQQLDAVIDLGAKVRERGLSVLIFTGYTKRQALEKVSRERLETACDVLIAGPYVRSLHIAEGLRGSSNKEYVFLSDRYSSATLTGHCDAEIIIDEFGVVTITGMKIPILGRP